MNSPPPAGFDPNGFSLEDGVVLLEASAGTGKTFALAHLVLRLLVERSLGLRELLVVTYTNAAAAELRDRIGRRIHDALDGLQAGGTWQGPDPVLEAWLERLPEGPQARATVQGRLLLALEDLDAADITTIHGFCQRNLRRQSMEAGRPPELTLETDAGELVRQVAHDYWRQQVLTLPRHLVEGVLQTISPADLEALLLKLDGDPGLRLDPLPAGLSLEQPLAARLSALWEEAWERFGRAWAAEGQALEQAFRDAAARWRADGASSTTPYAARPQKKRCALVDGWLAAQDPGGSHRAVLAQEELGSYFHPDTFCRVARKLEGQGREIRLPCPELMEAVAGVREGPAEAVLLHACHWGRAELVRRRERSGSVGFAQLLEGLDPGPGVPGPTPLLRAVGARYRAALIDEFQDTDPVQWRILRLAFADGAHLLAMVGDPKQAIYRFRGGDLDTYRLARGAAGRVHELLENRRSSPELLAGLNRLMAPAGLPRSALPVPEVAARSGRRGPAGMAPLRLLWLGGVRAAAAPLPARGELEARLPALVAGCVAELLEAAPALSAGEGQPPSPLRAGDIALLVHNHRQAEEQRSALEARGIASRLVSKADVFASPAATALQRLLDALADPADPNRLRLLAASPLLGWSARRIAGADDGEWSDLAGQLLALARDLPRQGPLGVLSRLVHGEGLARLRAGGRLLADLQQVAGLLQERLHTEPLGLMAAADWLRRLRLDRSRGAGEVPEAHQAHSDREDDAVSVITVHRSKGLEFPVVFCPYLWQAAGTPPAGRPAPGIRWRPPGAVEAHLDLHLCGHWGLGWQARRQHREAERAERERLAYVALTRAQHLLVLAWGPARGQQTNPLFPWLFPEEPLPDPDDDTIAARSDGDWRERLEEQIRRRGLRLELWDGGDGAPPSPATVPRPCRQGTAAECGPVPDRPLDTGWGRSSYTSWTRTAHNAAIPPAALDEGRDTSDPSPAAEEVPVDGMEALSWPEQGPLSGFARGAAAGDCLHRMLEQIDYRLPCGAEANRELVERERRRAGLEGEPLEPLLQGLDQVRRTPFGADLGALRVADLGPQRRLNEMNFDLTLGFARAGRLAAAFEDHPGGAFGSAYAAAVRELPVASRGFLTGSIDLVFTAAAGEEERWWVADWKSNWIGRRDTEGRPLACGPRHYGPEAMAAVMAANHYPLQAHLYLVALHRYLGWRLAGYDPERHLGGYVYVFLRGTPGERGGAGPAGSGAGDVRGTPAAAEGAGPRPRPGGARDGRSRGGGAVSLPAETSRAWVGALADALAEALPRLHGIAADPVIGELVQALTAALARGELELDLDGPPPPEVTAAAWPEAHRRALLASPLRHDPDGPLALEGSRLQWRRWLRQRQRVIDALVERAAARGTPPAAGGEEAAVAAALPHAPDARQREAMAAVLRHGLVLLEGGPGTGKTSTVAGMIAALRERQPDARIHLAAPTGKAAARLRAATGGRLPCTTLHRLLESRGERFGRHRGHPLELDLLVVDEVSMVDLTLMGSLLEALPAACRLVLVGDPAQLPPIAPGAVLRELQRPERRQGLGNAAVTLATTYRNAGAIARVAAALRLGIAAAPEAVASDPIALIRPLLRRLGHDDNLRWIPSPPGTLPAELLERLRRQQASLAELAGRCRPGTPPGCRELLAQRDRLMVMTPQRQGRWGLEAIHRALLGALPERDLQALPPGTPVLCRRNLPDLDLANGDVGILVGGPGASARVLFGDGDGDGFWIHPGQLSGAAEPALALTVHKAQGSEAEEVIVLLPGGEPRDPRLLYTALTRARRRALLLTGRETDGEGEDAP